MNCNRTLLFCSTNPVLYSFVMQQSMSAIPDPPMPVFSPWTPLLRDAGWIPEGEDEDEDGLVMHHQGFSGTIQTAIDTIQGGQRVSFDHACR